MCQEQVIRGHFQRIIIEDSPPIGTFEMLHTIEDVYTNVNDILYVMLVH
jgi:hypothetical protein